LRLPKARKPEAGQGDTSETDAEFFQRRAARDRLSHALGEFIELVVHNSFSYWFVFFDFPADERNR